MKSEETCEASQAHQRASIKWLLSKVFNNSVPDNILEPFYTDRDNQERLKPQIVVELANASLYCQALSNLYSDPNYQNLNHWAILQIMARKGVPVSEILGAPVTESILIQTNPIKLIAHMRVIESFMLLYAKEISADDRVNIVIRRLSKSNYQSSVGNSVAGCLLEWMSQVCVTLKNIIQYDHESGNTLISGIEPVHDFVDISDGISLAMLISYYCPKSVPWSVIRFDSKTKSELSLYNIQLVKNFSQKFLPYNVFHMSPEEVVFKKCSKLNIIVLLADLFNLFEIHPAGCVCFPGMESKVATLNTTSEVAMKQTPNCVGEGTDGRLDRDDRKGSTFVVHKSRGVTTLSSLKSQKNHHHELSLDGIFTSTKSIEKDDCEAAGMPTTWQRDRRPAFSGRRSRRNSFSEESQLTIENFGGSQDHINITERFERTKDRTLERKSPFSDPTGSVPVLRSSGDDARGTFTLRYGNDIGSEGHESGQHFSNYRENSTFRSDTGQSPSLSSSSSGIDRFKNKSICETNEIVVENMLNPHQPSSDNSIPPQGCLSAYTPFDLYSEEFQSVDNANKISFMCKKLQEKRRRIEQDKLKIQMAILRYNEKEESDSCADALKWENHSNITKCGNEPDNIDLDKYQQSIAIMNMNLKDIEQDIHRLALQHSQLQAHHFHASKLNQQNFGSQQQLTDPSNHRYGQHNFGSSPHLLQAFNSPGSTYGSRPTSCDTTQHAAKLGQLHSQSANDRQYKHSQSQLSMPHYLQGDTNARMSKRATADSQYDANPEVYFRSDSFGSKTSPSSHFPVPERNYAHFMQRRTWGYSPSISFESPQQQQPHLEPYINANAWSTEMEPDNWGNKSISNYSTPPAFLISRNGVPAGVHDSVQIVNHTQIYADTYNALQRQHSLTNLRDNSSPNLIDVMSQNSMCMDDAMAPQSICFIGDDDVIDDIEEKNINESLASTHIFDLADDNRIHRNSSYIRDSKETLAGQGLPQQPESSNPGYIKSSPCHSTFKSNNSQRPQLVDNNEKGFYISFDDRPKRPKPTLSTKGSPKTEGISKTGADHSEISTKSMFPNMEYENNNNENEVSMSTNATSQNEGQMSTISNGGELIHANTNSATYNKYSDTQLLQPYMFHQSGDGKIDANNSKHIMYKDVVNSSDVSLNETSFNSTHNSATPKKQSIVIGSDPGGTESVSAEEMERKKEKILLLSLQRRQQQEEAKARKDVLAAQNRERERQKEEDRARKKEQQAARRMAILQQYRFKKAIEEVEREGSSSEKSEPKYHSQTSAGSRVKQQRVTRPRPKTIHVDDASVDASDGSSISSRGKKGSTSNLAGYGSSLSNTLKRDLYGGSQDSLSMKGTKLYKQPASKSNRSILLNAVEYCVFPGVVNKESKQKVLEKIARSEAKHFLILFRDSGCQFRALYSYVPDTDQVLKLYGTGPSQVNEHMFDKFFKYNSGGKCFTQIHTKHLTVTIDAFTIHNSLWQGKRLQLPNKKDMALVI